jgi:hypothetical protein
MTCAVCASPVLQKHKIETPHAFHLPEGLIMKTFFCLLSLDLNFPMGKKEKYK